MLCPCQSGLDYSGCCQPFIETSGTAETAEQLMRSRYTAYSLQKIDYLYQTQVRQTRSDNLYTEIKDFASSVKFIRLQILSARTLSQTQAQVEFVAEYIAQNEWVKMQEVSDFSKAEGQWFYVSGKVSFDNQKLNRNQSCVCGSGKKFKRCCG